MGKSVSVVHNTTIKFSVCVMMYYYSELWRFITSVKKWKLVLFYLGSLRNNGEDSLYNRI